jgi:hypothetical protein
VKKLGTVLLSLVATVGLVSVGTTSFASGPTWANCPAETFCTYTDIQGSGNSYYYSPQPAGTCVEVGGIFDNNISSTWNHSPSFSLHGKTIYQGHGCTGLGQNWATGEIKNYSMQPSTFDNTVSSFVWH